MTKKSKQQPDSGYKKFSAVEVGDFLYKPTKDGKAKAYKVKTVDKSEQGIVYVTIAGDQERFTALSFQSVTSHGRRNTYTYTTEKEACLDALQSLYARIQRIEYDINVYTHDLKRLKDAEEDAKKHYASLTD